jgi:hypothetical protein
MIPFMFVYAKFSFVPQRDTGRLGSANILIGLYYYGHLVCGILKFHETFSVVGANICIALKHTLLVIYFYSLWGTCKPFCAMGILLAHLKEALI